MNAAVHDLDLRCYVVNLKRRPDRREQIAAQIPDDLPTRFTSDWPEEFDGHEITTEHLRASGNELFPWKVASDNPWWNRHLKWGEVGCTLAHLACWRAAVADGVEYALILEDDAVLGPRLLTELRTTLRHLGRPHPFDLLYLGRYPLVPDQPAPSSVSAPGIRPLVVPGYSHCTFGYMLTRSGLRAVLDARLDQSIVPVDEFLPALYHPHPREDLRRRFPSSLQVLAFDPPLVTQRPKEEAGSDTEDSAFVLPEDVATTTQ